MTRLVQVRFGGTEATACAMPRSSWLASSCVCGRIGRQRFVHSGHMGRKTAGVLSYLDVEQQPDVLRLGPCQILEQVDQARQRLLGLAQRGQGAQVRPVAVGDLFVDAEAPLERSILLGARRTVSSWSYKRIMPRPWGVWCLLLPSTTDITSSAVYIQPSSTGYTAYEKT